MGGCRGQYHGHSSYCVHWRSVHLELEYSAYTRIRKGTFHFDFVGNIFGFRNFFFILRATNRLHLRFTVRFGSFLINSTKSFRFYVKSNLINACNSCSNRKSGLFKRNFQFLIIFARLREF